METEFGFDVRTRLRASGYRFEDTEFDRREECLRCPEPVSEFHDMVRRWSFFWHALNLRGRCDHDTSIALDLIIIFVILTRACSVGTGWSRKRYQVTVRKCEPGRPSQLLGHIDGRHLSSSPVDGPFFEFIEYVGKCVTPFSEAIIGSDRSIFQPAVDEVLFL